MNIKIYFVIIYVLVCCNFSGSWSSNIKSLFKQKAISPFGDLSPNIMESIASGAQMALDQCREIFKWDKWNCPQSAFSRQAMQHKTKEFAYTEAIIAAGIIYSITKNCSKGDIDGCGCDKNMPLKKVKLNGNVDNTRSTDWTWGGCSDDTTFSEKLIEQHLLTDNFDIQAFVSRHNNKIGFDVVKKTMVKQCLCHGLSGSCTLQTCWMQLAPFKEVAQKLRSHYDNAIQLSFNNNKDAILIGNNARQLTDISKNLIANKLAYLENSPNYCIEDHLKGWPGTRGRICSKQSKNGNLYEQQSCRNICRSCGYKVRKQKKSVSFRCNCKFLWCCEVKCDICREIVNEYFCD